MQLSQDSATNGYMIRKYVPGEIYIHDQVYTHSIMISSDQISPWEVDGFKSIKNNNLCDILKLNPEVIILGTGVAQHFLNPDVTAPIVEKHIGFEVMTTQAACATYNLLVAEGRRVVAGLLIR